MKKLRFYLWGVLLIAIAAGFALFIATWITLLVNKSSSSAGLTSIIVVLLGLTLFVLTFSVFKKTLRYFTLWNILRKKIYIGSKVSYCKKMHTVNRRNNPVYKDICFRGMVCEICDNEGYVLDKDGYKKWVDIKSLKRC